MRALDYFQMLEIAERGRSCSLLERAAIMVAIACPERSWESIGKLTIGERDNLLLELRQQTFGNHLQGLVDCPHCRLALSLEFETDSVRQNSRQVAKEFAATIAEYTFRFRALNCEDVLAVNHQANQPNQACELFARCILQADCAGAPVAVGALPAEILEKVSLLIEESDPDAELRLAMKCPACRHSWHAVFDVVSFLWNEVIACSRKLLLEVHTLASAYGWSEEEILQMSPWRRASYLAMVG